MGTASVIFRTDGSEQIGLGHLYRCRALAEMLSPDFSCYLAFRHLPAGIRTELTQPYRATLDLSAVRPAEEVDSVLTWCRALENTPAGHPTVVVLDGYHFDTAYQAAWKKTRVPLVCIDDIHAYHFVADVVINHAGGVTPDDYSAEPDTQFCLGPRYALLQGPFRSPTDPRLSGDEKRTFICLGGADPPNATLTVLQKCVSVFPDSSYDVVLGGAYLHQAAFDHYLAGSRADVSVHRNLKAVEMARLMRACGSGITSPSTVSFEYLSVGGLLYLYPIADNQASIYAYYLREGVAFSFTDSFPVLDQKRVARSIDRQNRLFDGQSAARYLHLFQSLIGKCA